MEVVIFDKCTKLQSFLPDLSQCQIHFESIREQNGFSGMTKIQFAVLQLYGYNVYETVYHLALIVGNFS